MWAMKDRVDMSMSWVIVRRVSSACVVIEAMWVRTGLTWSAGTGAGAAAAVAEVSGSAGGIVLPWRGTCGGGRVSDEGVVSSNSVTLDSKPLFSIDWDIVAACGFAWTLASWMNMNDCTQVVWVIQMSCIRDG